MTDKRQIFDRLQKSVTRDAREPCHAIYFDANPPELTEWWYLVDADDRRGFLVQSIHEMIPVSSFDREIGPLSERYGTYTDKGVTYEIEPFILGVKRDGEDMAAFNGLQKEIYADRENYKITLYNNAFRELRDPNGKDPFSLRQYLDDPDYQIAAVMWLNLKIDELVETMDDEEYADAVDELVRQSALEKPISYEEACQRAVTYWDMENKTEKDFVDAAVAENDINRRLYKRLSFGHLKFD